MFLFGIEVKMVKTLRSRSPAAAQLTGRFPCGTCRVRVAFSFSCAPNASSTRSQGKHSDRCSTHSQARTKKKKNSCCTFFFFLSFFFPRPTVTALTF